MPPQYVYDFTSEIPALNAYQAWAALGQGDKIGLSTRLSLAPVRTMHEARYELIGFDPDHLQHFKTLDLIGEIINWRMRLFVPVSAQGKSVPARLMADPLI